MPDTLLSQLRLFLPTPTLPVRFEGLSLPHLIGLLFAVADKCLMYSALPLVSVLLLSSPRGPETYGFGT